MQIDFNVIAVLATIIIGIVGSIAGIVIPLHLSLKHSVDAIQQEIKDFHGRMERQDAEFKAFMKAEEQKRTKIING